RALMPRGIDEGDDLMFPNKLASALLILSIAACSSNSDSGRGNGGSSGNGWGASGGQDGSGQGCGFTSSDPCEDTCLNSTCYQQASVCTQSNCGDLIDYGLACKTDTCFDGCLEQYPGAVDPLINMYDCVDTCGC